MQTLIFDTVEKTAHLYVGEPTLTPVIFSYDRVTTVRISTDGYYEAMQKSLIGDSVLPVARFPICNTNMLIKNKQ